MIMVREMFAAGPPDRGVDGEGRAAHATHLPELPMLMPSNAAQIAERVSQPSTRSFRTRC